MSVVEALEPKERLLFEADRSVDVVSARMGPDIDPRFREIMSIVVKHLPATVKEELRVMIMGPISAWTARASPSSFAAGLWIPRAGPSPAPCSTSGRRTTKASMMSSRRVSSPFIISEACSRPIPTARTGSGP